jgi:hypothetical protein
MTRPADHPPVCQWCHQPVTGDPGWWDGQPQCGDPFACDKRTTHHGKADR